MRGTSNSIVRSTGSPRALVRTDHCRANQQAGDLGYGRRLGWSGSRLGTRIAAELADRFENLGKVRNWGWEVLIDAHGHFNVPTAIRLANNLYEQSNIAWFEEPVPPESFDALVLPGGVVNADHLRMDDDAVDFVRDFFEQKKPVAVICHGAWIMTDADVVDGRTLTSYPSLRTDLVNAGASWVDEEVVVDQGLVSSRTPDDLPAFCRKLVEEVAEGVHDRQHA